MKSKSIIVKEEGVIFFFFFILDNQFHLQSPFELFEDNFYTTVGMIQT